MKLSTREDIEVPISFVYEALTDVPGWERAARSRGAGVRRTDGLSVFGPGMTWDVTFPFRNKQRQADVTLNAAEPLQMLSFLASGPSFDATVKVELVALSAQRTRLIAGTDIRPRTLAARVMLQSLKLARARVDRKYESRISQLCAEFQARYRAQA